MQHHEQAATTGVPIWVAVVLPVVTALLGLLGGGIVRFMLDRRAEIARAVGFARVVREELQDAAQRLEADNLYLLPTSAWEQHSSELAGALLEDEFTLLTACYRTIWSLNARITALVAPIPGAPPLPATVDDEMRRERWLVAQMVQHGLASVAWLARGDVPLWRQRRIKAAMTPHPLTRCRCGHRWDHHRWEWKDRGWWRLRWRDHDMRSVAHECNVRGCDCRWFREPERRHLPHWIQRRGPGSQALPLGVDVEPEEVVDTSIPPTAQPGAVVPEDESQQA